MEQDDDVTDKFAGYSDHGKFLFWCMRAIFTF